MVDWSSLAGRNAMELIEKSGRSYARFSLACSLKCIKTPPKKYFATAINSLESWGLFRSSSAEDVMDLFSRLQSPPYMWATESEEST